LGLDALEAGQVDQAVQYLMAASAEDPSEPALWMNLAKAHRTAADDEGERAALEKVLEIDQLHLMGRLRLAELHERRSELGAATDHWAMFLGVCVNIPNHTPELAAMIRHAREFVEARRLALAEAVDDGLGEALARASERDRRRASAAADLMLGRRKTYTNQCHGFFYPFLPADEFFDRDHFPWLVKLEAATAVIREELEAILASPDPGLMPYIDLPPGTPDNFWSELDKSANWSALHLWRDGSRIDEVCKRAPRTAELVESLPLACIAGRAPAVFFSILKAGKRIPPHAGVTNIRTIIHLPLIVPGKCGFRVGGEVREWREGEAFAFDDTIEHEAWNDSDQDRALLILDCWNPYLSEDEQRMIVQMFAISEAQRPDRPLRG
jgi:aspartyl/asparaginyl beta-hydroxylase (cupin superfamily)